MTATATATAKPKASPAILKSVLGTDGKLKYTLPTKEAKKLAAAIELCRLLDNVMPLQDVAAPAKEALDALHKRLCPSE